MGGAAHDLAFLVAEHPLKTVGVDDLLTLFGRHGSQVAHCRADHSLARGWKLAELAVKLARFLLLFLSQVLPRFHALQYPLPLLRR